MGLKIYHLKDVKEAVKKLKEKFPINSRENHKINIIIDEIFGMFEWNRKLVWNEEKQAMIMTDIGE